MRSGNDLSVSVVIVAKRAEKTIGNAFESLDEQTHQPSETILVVDSLDDPTVQVAGAFPVRVVESEKGGIGAAREKGVSTATGEVVVFIDSDCVADERWLEALVGLFLERRDVVVQAGRYITTQKIRERSGNSKSTGDIWLDFAPTMNFSFRRSLIATVGNFDPDFAEGGEDMDFCLRLKKKGHRIFYNPESIVFHPGSGKASRKAWRDGKTRVQAFRKHGMALIGAATVALAHSICLICALILLGLGMYIEALVVFSPSLLHRTYRAAINLRFGKGIGYTVRGFLLGYLGNLSFLVNLVASVFESTSKSRKTENKLSV